MVRTSRTANKPNPPPGDLLAALGRRIRAAREARGESRSALAARSGVSLRFLAQLESGSANISLLRLHEVAQALGLGIAPLLEEAATPRPAVSGISRAPRHARQLLAQPTARAAVEALVAGRTEPELQEVRDWLAARFAMAGGPLVALLGLRGAGKSTVGHRLARRLRVPFYELDALIETAAGIPLAQIFELQGDAYYRRLERETLARFLATTPAGVLATGGGLVTDPETYALLRRRCRTVWLRAEPELHWQRVMRQGDRRPMRDNPAAMQELRALLAARTPLYAQSDHTIDTTGQSAVHVTARIAALIQKPPRPVSATS
jgi:XRE family aerobic/anaerobic benzoate catabolism transcriptional regulator